IRGRAASIGTMMIWISCIIVTQTFPIWRDEYGPAFCFGVYAAFMLPAFIFILFFMPETKQRSLEELEKILYDKKK
ncbi:MAG: MFS transporter, partial [Thermoguttaceae bacterium]